MQWHTEGHQHLQSLIIYSILTCISYGLTEQEPVYQTVSAAQTQGLLAPPHSNAEILRRASHQKSHPSLDAQNQINKPRPEQARLNFDFWKE